MDESKIQHYNKLTKKQLVSKILELEEHARQEYEKKIEPANIDENIRLIYENSYDIIWQINEKLVFTAVNSSVESILKYKPEEVIGRPFSDFFTEASLKKAKNTIAEKIAAGKSPKPGYNEYEMIDKEGNIIPVEISSSLITDEDGNLKGFFGVSRDISDRKDAMRLLEQSRERLDAALKSSGIGLWEQDFENDTVYRSDNWYTMLGYRPVDKNRTLSFWFNKIHPEDMPAVEKVKQAHESGENEVFKVEHRLKTKAGNWKWVLNWGKITERDGDGKPLKAVGVHIDIDEQKRAQEEIRRIETERKHILDSLDDLFFYYDKDLHVGMLNKAAKKYLGNRADNCIGKECFKVWRDGQDEHCDHCHVLESLKKKKTCEKDAEVGGRFYHFKAVPVKGKNGEITGVAEFGQDITEKREAENALKVSERKYRLLTETARDIIGIHDLDGKIKYLNQAGVNLIGKDRKNVTGLNVMEFVAPAYKKKTAARQNKRMKEEQGIFLYESEFITAAGKTFPVEVSSSVMKTEDGANDVLIVARDITERKKIAQKIKDYSKDLEKIVNKRTKELKKQKEDLEKSQLALTYLLEDVNESREEMNRINKKLEEVNRELEAFSYSVSHDLKAPLRAIDGFSQILLEDYTDKLDEDGKRYIRIVRENTQKMGDLIQDLLDFSRAGRKKLKKGKLDLQSITHEVVDEFSNETAEREIRVDIAPLPKVDGDENLIRQVLFNLISNAVKFTRNESESEIIIKAEERDNYHWISVKDNGVGFDMKYVDKLFNVFQRLHTVDQFEGTGVGLALVKRIIKKHGGEVKAEAKSGQGACFSFSLPKTYAE